MCVSLCLVVSVCLSVYKCVKVLISVVKFVYLYVSACGLTMC